MTDAPRLIETMRADGGRIALLDLHLARLAASADALGYGLDADAVRQRAAGAAGAVGEGGHVVRLTLGPAGDVEVETRALDGAPLRTAWVDPEPFRDAGSPRCTHKTTDRGHYRRRWDRARARGADEAVLVNAHGEVTEGTRTNVWARLDGRLWTPPVAAGGLAGVYRAHVLATHPDAGERTLTPGDLGRAEAVFLTNAVRGWMPVRLVEGVR